MLIIVYFVFFSGPSRTETNIDSGIDTENPDDSDELPETGGNEEKQVNKYN